MIGMTEIVKRRIEEVVHRSTSSDKVRETGMTDRAEGQVKQVARNLASTWCPGMARPPSEEPSRQTERNISYQCPVCGNALPHLVALPPFAAPCCECGSYLWCRRRASAGGVVLEAVSGRAPEPWEVEEVVDFLGRYGTLDRVILDLSNLAIVDSSFLAALVVMKKRLHAYGGTLCLCGLRPIVREIFDRVNFNMLFGIVKTEEDCAARA